MARYATHIPCLLFSFRPFVDRKNKRANKEKKLSPLIHTVDLIKDHCMYCMYG